MDLLPYFSIETWALLTLFIGLLMLYGIWPYGVFRKLGIAGPIPLPFIGTTFWHRYGRIKFDLGCFRKYGRIWGTYDGRQPVLVVTDPVVIKTVLVKECYSSFLNRWARVDFLQLMLESQKSVINHESDGVNHTYKGLTDSEILVQAIIFIFAGYETISKTLCYLKYELAIHPDVQQKLQEQIDEFLSNEAPVTYDTLMQMDYLDMVISETLRMHPVVGRLQRVCKKAIEINRTTIPKGIVIVIPPDVLHCDPEHWPEPEQFRPESSRDRRYNESVMQTALLESKHSTDPTGVNFKRSQKPAKPIILKIIHRAKTKA